MGDLNAEQIAQRAFDLNLLDDRQLQSVWGSLGTREVSADQFVQALLRQELLTNYQLERLVKGERGGYFYGDYKVLYLVAKGSFARVFRAVHKDTSQVVALKVLRRRFSDDLEQTDQFYAEGQMGRSLRHPNIVPIYEVFSQGMNHFLVMEFVEGQNLREFVRSRQKIEPPEATRLMIDVAAGMHYAVERGVSHRDLKLTNILVSSRGQAKLVDFGLAAADERMSDEAIADMSNPRTIDYAGLERATGVRKDDGRSDIYFLGCIYYHMLSGKPPLQETKDRIQRLSRTRYVDVVPIWKLEPDLPRTVMAVVSRSMELDTEKRYQTPGQLLVDLQLSARRMADGKDLAASEVPALDGDSDGIPSADSAEAQRLAAMLVPQNERRVLMFIESNIKMQDIFRDGMKRSGYRVLLTRDPERALGRFQDDDKAADLVVFSTGHLGKPVLEAFNSFGQNEATRDVPAVLLLGNRHGEWEQAAQKADHRVVVSMPLKLREFRSLLAKLLPPVDSESTSES